MYNIRTGVNRRDSNKLDRKKLENSGMEMMGRRIKTCSKRINIKMLKINKVQLRINYPKSR